MPNKNWNKLNDLDQRLRKLFPTVQWNNDETICTIELFGGFELFNTRAYHNYEDWSSGYRITTGKRYGNLTVQAEDLDDAITLLENKIKAFREDYMSKVHKDETLCEVKSDVLLHESKVSELIKVAEYGNIHVSHITNQTSDVVGKLISYLLKDDNTLALWTRLMLSCNHLVTGDRVSYEYAKPYEQFRYFITMEQPKECTYRALSVEASTFNASVLKMAILYILHKEA